MGINFQHQKKQHYSQVLPEAMLFGLMIGKVEMIEIALRKMLAWLLGDVKRQ
jgi:hypothetical protein